MKAAYFDMFSGVSGDMVLGALVDCGFPAGELEKIPAALGLHGVKLEINRGKDHGIAATQVTVAAADGHHHRGLSAINAMIDGSLLDGSVKELAKRIFLRLGEAESAVHGVDIEKIHFHEVGALDSIVDIVGAAAGVVHLDLKEFYAGPFRFGTGFVKFSHGRLALPVPAVARLTLGYPTERTPVEAELTTPTGAAIVTALTPPENFSVAQPLKFDQVGYGMGSRKHEDRPNLLRLFTGEVRDAAGVDSDVVELECNIDDMNPEYYDFLLEKLLGAGALDVFLAPVQMKKNRPGVWLHVVCDARDVNTMAKLVFENTSTIGVRYHTLSRITLERDARQLTTPWGEVSVKEVTLPGGGRRIKPEYDSLCTLALREDCSLLELARRVEAFLNKK